MQRYGRRVVIFGLSGADGQGAIQSAAGSIHFQILAILAISAMLAILLVRVH
jgi:hypothetical protein